MLLCREIVKHESSCVNYDTIERHFKKIYINLHTPNALLSIIIIVLSKIF